MRRHAGFTLIEVLVALGLMALLGLMSWRGLDTLLRTREVTQSRTDEVALVQVSLGQWRADLNAQMALPGTLGDSSLLWNGSVLRILRRSTTPMPDGGDAGMQVVAWTLGNGQWTRWQSEPLMQNDEWTQAWRQAQTWALTAGNVSGNTAQEVLIHPVRAWQIYYHRDGAWSNPLSSAVNLPEGVRLVLELTDTPEFQGKLTLDWVRPTFTAVKQ